METQKEDVSHRGIVKSVTAASITVLTDDDCRCEGCAVAAICNKSEGSESAHDLVTVDTPDAARFRPGERVEIIATSRSTMWATLWALILPTLLFVGVLLWVRLEWPALGDWSIGIALGALVVYSLLLYLFRNALAGRIVWKVRPLDR